MEKLSLKMPVPPAVQKLHSAFKVFGHPLFLVGGSVRDFVASKFHQSTYSFKDHDLATPVVPDTVEDTLKKAVDQKLLPHHTNIRAVGKAFGVILVSFDEQDFEIATFRKDAKTSDGRRPDSVTFSSIEDDAARRDLTINALYYNMDTEEVWDFHNGLDDLRGNRVRFVGDPKERLEEDRLRALRFVRFHGRIHPGAYHTLNRDAARAISNCKLKPVISEERIRDEFLKGLKSAQHQQNFLYNLNDLGLMEQVFPDLDLFLFINPLIDNSLVIIAQILRGNASKVVYERLMALKYTAHEAQTVEFLLKLKDYQRPEDVVRFKKDRKRCLFDNKDLLKVAKLFTEHFSMIKKMLEFPYPTVKGEEFMDKFQGKELGEQINMREIENFKAYSAGGSPSISCD